MAPLATFLESRERLRERRVGDGGREVCLDLTSRLDAAIFDLFEEMGAAEDCAIVAIGGYGRGELSPYSDVDLMLLHGTQDPSEVAASLFRPLWDAGLRLGHSVRTVKEAASSARERFETHTTLLTSRLVTGSEILYRQFSEKIATVTKARPLTRYLLADERERRAEAPYLLMATNVKTGRGGLRTLQAFEWERRREEMIGRFGPEMSDEEEIARESLLRVRNALHAVTGRPHDVFTPELRESAARWLGIDTYELGSMLVKAMRTVDRLATERWSDLVDVPGSTRRWTRGRRDGTSIDAGLPTVSDFVALLDGGEQGRAVVERMLGSGDLAGLLPEWEIVNVAPQLAPFHEHPATDHLWRAVEEMKALIDGDDPHFHGIAGEVGSRTPLLLAAFLHDIGKGQGEDHSAVGADAARRFCQRLGCDPALTSLVERAVRHHLLLSRSATRRDLDDPAVIEEVTQSVGDLTSLQVLYLLTVADSKATGTTMWTSWRATLIRTLFLRCAARFGAEQSHATGATREQVLELTEADQAGAVESHLELMPPDYLRSVDPEDVLWHAGLIETRDEVVNLGIRHGPGAQTVAVVGPGRPEFRRLVAEAFAANGMDVLAARLNTRADGMVVDTFQVRDDVTGAAVPEERWLRARSDLIAALSGGLDTGSKMAARKATYGSGESPGVAPIVQVSVDNASGETVVTVRASDRIGRLAEILSGFSSCGLEIRLALLDSRGGEIVDTFHVSGPRPGDEAAIQDLEHHIATSIAR